MLFQFHLPQQPGGGGRAGPAAFCCSSRAGGMLAPVFLPPSPVSFFFFFLQLFALFEGSFPQLGGGRRGLAEHHHHPPWPAGWLWAVWFGGVVLEPRFFTFFCPDGVWEQPGGGPHGWGCPWHRGGLCLSLTVGSCLWRRKTPAVLPINTLPLSTLLPLYFQPCASPPPRGARIRPRCPFPIPGMFPSSWGGAEKGSSPLPMQPPSLCSPARARPPRSSQQSPRCVRRRGELGSE